MSDWIAPTTKGSFLFLIFLTFYSQFTMKIVIELLLTLLLIQPHAPFYSQMIQKGLQ